MKLPKLNLPTYDLDIKSSNGRLHIYDIIRKKQIILTPEEWVRQNIMHFLISDKKYPKALIRVESGLKYNELMKRSDIVVFGRDGLPFLLVECKSFDIQINQSVFDQVALYNKAIKAKYIMTTNGDKHYCCEIDFDNSSYKFINEIPDFE